MKQKLIDLYNKMSPYISKLYSMFPFAVGVAAGYFGHGVIKLAFSTSLMLIKTLLRI